MTPGNALPELGLPLDPAFRGNLDIVNNHIRFAPFRIKGFAVMDAATGEQLGGPYITEAAAQRVLKKATKKYPSAFIQKADS